ncbi:1-acyl-sn-glycerol-3-phosphate acyltransferase [Aquihabitans sp. G128]|uniref:lysophospholipid acyltransferase family protein n=1 Tax=Aquihabitans sp. G128 TaxID=2849779 RepID=UPI001C21F07C|nr:lysophospholipid acyltransferase family protein [Aquihabitans sp. G128]QXC61744.1 1-acyl-sn-glycerol-3-phosphate acyltransferase [Aquihabitans sp. G128]
MVEKKGVEKALGAVQAAAGRVPSVRDLVSQSTFPYRAPTTPLSVEPLPDERQLGADYDSGWARKLPARYARYFVTEGLVRPIIAGLAQPERRGLDRLADLDGPVIFAANHHSHIDAGLLITSLPEPYRHQVFAAAAADYFFDTRLKATASALVLNAIPIERSKVTRTSADQARELIDQGWSMVIFPEGGRSPDGWGHPFRGGAAYLALKCDIPVVPVHLAGTGRILPKGKSTPKRSRTVVTFGKPLVAHEGERSTALSRRIEAAVAALADEATTDWYSARRRAAAGETPSLSSPQSGVWRRAWAVSGQRKRRTSTKAWPDLGS